MKSKTIEVVERDITPLDFYTRFILPRIPCILNYTDYVNPLLASPTHLKTRSSPCQVETPPYGSGKARVTIPFSEFITRLEAGESLYKTTQYTKDDTYIHSPLTASDFTKPDVLGNLVPQQVNLWVGSSTKPTSSSLHHDFADNLYVLLRGRKHFTLFPPTDAHKMDLHGKVVKIHANGVISYDLVTRSDLARYADVCEYRLAMAYEDGGDAEGIERLEDEFMEHQKRTEECMDEDECGVQPPSFSKVSPEVLHCPTRAASLGLSGGNRIEFTLEAGQMLYLPASYFHEVKSEGDLHVAFNYWMFPPSTLGSFESPYEDSYWLDYHEEVVLGGDDQDIAER